VATVGGLILVFSLALLSCSDSRDEAVTEGAPADGSGDSAGATLDLSTLGSAGWVEIYGPERASNGYTLALFRGRVPMLMDMNGRVVHSWSEARARSRVRLLEDGSLLAIGLGRTIRRYDWDGDLVWELRLEEKIPHHDVIRLANGNTMVLVRARGSRTDDLLEVDDSGTIVWEWPSGEHLAPYFDRTAVRRRDVTHINSVQELPANRLFRQGDRRFRPGNLLLSARNLNAVFLIDRETGEVVWHFDEALDMQHEALMIGPGLPGQGNILVFNNGYGNRYEYRKSSVIEVDPRTKSIVWSYSSNGFFSPTGGAEQPLANGNVLVSSSRGRRAFEVTRSGRIVWQWAPPFEPKRPQRYPYDYCPQMASLGRPKEEPVQPPDGYRHIDRAVYRFAPRGSLRKVKLDGRRRIFLRDNNQCVRLFLPAEATVDLSYGLDRQKLRRSGRARHEVDFGLRLTVEESGEEADLLRETVGFPGRAWRGRRVDLDRYAHRWVRLCVKTEEVGSPEGRGTEEFAYWENLAISAGDESTKQPAEPDELLEELTEEELEVRRRHLRAMGYVD
jgi:hypothetical protein